MRDAAGTPPETALGVLVRLSEHLNQSHDLEDLLSGAVEILGEMLGEPTGWITLGEDRADPDTLVGRHLPPALDAQGQSALRWGPCRCQRPDVRDGTQLRFSACERLEMVIGDTDGLLYHLALPLRVGRRPIGMLNFVARADRPLSYEEQSALTTGAQAIAMAAERYRVGIPARSHQEVGQQAMLNLSSQLLGSLDPSEIMDITTRVVSETLSVPIVSLRLLDESGRNLVLRAGIGWPPDQVGTHLVDLNDPRDIAACSAREQRTIMLDQDGHHSGAYELNHSISRLGLLSAACVPMIVGGRLIGTIGAASYEGARFGPDERRFLALAADQAALALDRGDLVQATRRQLRDLALMHDHAAEQTRQLSQTYGITLAVLGDALELRDQDTMGHTERVVALAESIGRQLGLSEEELMHLRWGAYVHDLGKIGVPDAVLRKPGPLTPEEWELMQRHPEQGYHLLERLFFLSDALDVVRYHHERFDGKGYPLGLKGEEIPLLARIFAVADAYDAMTNDRPYRQAMSAKMALAEVHRHSGTQFDPSVVDALVHLPRKGRDIGKVSAGIAGSEGIRNIGMPVSEGQTLLDFARTASFLLGAPDLQSALHQVLAQVHTMFGYPTCSVLLLNAETGMLHFQAHRGYDPDILQRMQMRVDREGIVGHVLETGDAYYAADVLSDPHYVQASPRVRSEVAIPIRSEGMTIGVLDIESTEVDAFPSSARTVLEAFAVLAGLAVQRSLHDEDLSRQALTDSVTGLGNRRALDHALEREHSRAARHSRPMSLVKLTVDGYEGSVREGRQQADEVLRTVSRLLTETCRKEDHLIRIDGGEFALLLPETAKVGALLVAERLRADAARTELRSGQHLSMSIGISSFPEDATTLGTLRDSADHAMQRAMRRGGGEIVAAAPRQSSPSHRRSH